MKRFLIFLIVLAVALLGLYVWWQGNASRVIAREVQRLARAFFVNPQDLQVKSDPIKMTGLREARVPELVIKGHDLALREGGELAHVKIVLTDVDVAGPPFRFVRAGAGYYIVTVTDGMVTDYIRKRGVRLMVVNIPLDTVSVRFSRKAGATLTGEVELPLVKKRVPLTARGKLVPGSKVGHVDFRVEGVEVLGGQTNARRITDALDVLNPVVDLSEWPLVSDIVAIETGDATATVRGRITAVRSSFF